MYMNSEQFNMDEHMEGRIKAADYIYNRNLNFDEFLSKQSKSFQSGFFSHLWKNYDKAMPPKIEKFMLEAIEKARVIYQSN